MKVPSPEIMQKKRSELIQIRSQKNDEYNSVKSALAELEVARKAVQEHCYDRSLDLQKRRSMGELE